MEYKFRYYSEEYKELLPVLDIDFVNDCFYILPFAELEGGNQIEVKGLDKLEQYIGLEDQHGIKIYDGDKVYIDHPCWREEAKVQFINGSFVFVVKSNQAIIPGWTIEKETWKLKIIGTIHD